MHLPFTFISLCLHGSGDLALARMSSCGVLCAYTLAICSRKNRSRLPWAHAIGHAGIHVLPILRLDNPVMTPRQRAWRATVLAALLALWHSTGPQHRAYGFDRRPAHWHLAMLAYVLGASFSARCT